MSGEKRHRVTVCSPAPPKAGHLNLGGRSDAGSELTVDSRSLWRDGQPWFPVMGEFHYARYPRAQWEAELRKMRAGGITLVGTYVFWILHEERRSTYRWDGDRDLRAFVDLCSEIGLEVVARIGPWGHGESRNGGFPDWLLTLGLDLRTNDPAYLEIVRGWYAQIVSQLDGRFWSTGGPVVAVQIENELYDQRAHLLALKRIAQEVGFDVPLWAATGWGRADIPRDEYVPLFGGYSEAAWDEHDAGWARQSRLHFFFTPVRDDFTIGSDLRQDAGTPGAAQDDGGGAIGGNVPGATGPELDRYPFATCELGAGMYAAYHRRPLVEAEDVAAISLVKLGSGSVWQGYYLYQGATQAIGELSTMQESHATGYPNDCPVLSYDFQAPLGEFGQVRPSYALLRQQALWLAAEGATLARMQSTFPADGPADVDDHATLRWAVRSDGESGYLFVNNHQPVERLERHDQVGFEIEGIGDRTLSIPSGECTIEPGVFFAWPLRLDVAGARLSATAQVVTRAQLGDIPVLILTATEGLAVEIQVENGKVETRASAVEIGADGVTRVLDLEPGPDCSLTVTGPSGTAQVRVLDAEEGRQVALVDGKVYVAASPVVRFGNGPAVVTTNPREIVRRLETDGWRTLDLPAAPPSPAPKVTPLREARPARSVPRGGPLKRASAPLDDDFAAAAAWQIDVPADALSPEPSRDDDLLLRVEYIGDVARLYAGARLLADDFWAGRAWEVGLRRFSAFLSEGLRLEVLPLSQNAPIYLSPGVEPEYKEGTALQLIDVSLHRRVSVTLPAYSESR